MKANGLFESERIITSAQGADIKIAGVSVINFCANNYLGLSSHPKVIDAAKHTIDTRGYGMSSVRFICGTQDIHKELERKISAYLGTDDTILYTSAFDANCGVFEPLFDEQDAIISDELSHPSIIDGIRLCKAEHFKYDHNDITKLEDHLKETLGNRSRIIVTDGVFSMDGTIARLDEIVALAEKYNAMVMIDECHATGLLGKTGRGTPEYHDVVGKIDIITGTFGKALGGASGGFASGRKEIIELLGQRSRPYLFSNTLMPSIVGASIAVFDILDETSSLRDKLKTNTRYFRNKMVDAGFDVIMGEHPIVPILLYDALLAQKFAARLLEEGIYVVGLFYPVVAKDKARIRVQVSATHEIYHLDKAISAFTKVGAELGVIN